ncbi:MCE family protein [Nonomuraea sp. NPDC050556]|uniref:MCE family protein n=1 Tax=Nonomuraea sp. NPDC050556 TaxID=3364369 RepID=UPI003793695C
MTTAKAAVKLALFALVTSLCVAVLAVTISGAEFTATTVYRALFSDATGLAAGDDVRIAGVRVGRVEDVTLNGERAEVAFTVRERTHLPKSVIASIRWRNLLGDRYLTLATGPGEPGTLRPDEPITTTRPALDVTALFNGFRPLLKAIKPADVNKLSWQIVQVLQGEGGTVESLLGHIAALTGTLADRDAVIGGVVDNLTAVLGEIAGRDREYGRLIDDLHDLVGGLSGDRKAIGDALTSLDELAGVTGGFLTEARPDVKADLAYAESFFAGLNAERAGIDEAIKDVPLRLNQLTRAVSYGSWFNFYLCSLQVETGPKIVNESARCH